MHLYLIRHAHALDGQNDAARPLSEKGVRQIRKLGRFLREADAFAAAEIWHSPLLRAEATAVLLAKHLKTDASLLEISGLRPDDAPDSIVRKLNVLRRPVAVVGHEPHLSALASLLVASEAAPPRFLFKKSAALRLDRSEGVWAVRWQLSPELL